MKTACKLILLIPLLFTGCSKPADPVQPVDVSKLVERDNLSYLAAEDGTVQEPYTGEAVKHYPSGETAEKITFKSGKLHGPHETFSKTGQLQTKVNYTHGRKEGLVEEHYENGQVKEKTSYERGRRHGPFETYYENGLTKRKGSYKNGKRHGTLQWYGPNAELLDSTTYENGEEVIQDSIAQGAAGQDSNTENADVPNTKDRDSLAQAADTDIGASWYDETSFKDPLTSPPLDSAEEEETGEEKPFETYYENGQLKAKRMLKDGKNHGSYETYYENGQAEVKATFKEGKPHGLYEKYDENGQLIEKGMFKDGRLIEKDLL